MHAVRITFFLISCFYFIFRASKHYSLILVQRQYLVTIKASPTNKRFLQRGNHTNVPPLDIKTGKRISVHDPLFLRKTSRRSDIPEEEKDSMCAKPGSGVEGEKGNANLIKIRDHIESKSSRKSSQIKLLCAIYTYSGNVNMTNAVGETWARRCDGALFASDMSSEATGHFHIPSSSRNGYGYKGMIQRTRAILAYLYDYFLNDYDFFHICGDDVYIIVENMKEFLQSDEAQSWESVPGHYLFAGFWAHWGKMKNDYFYLGGGSGYTISRRGLKAFVQGPLQTCNPYQEGSAEDVWFF